MSDSTELTSDQEFEIIADPNKVTKANTSPSKKVLPKPPTMSAPAKTPQADAAAAAPVGHVNDCPLMSFSSIKEKGLPKPVEDLVLYKNPIHSGVAIALFLVGFALATYDFGFSLIWLIGCIGKWVLLLAVIAVGGFHIFQKYIQKKEEPENIIKSKAAPHLDVATGAVSNYLPSTADTSETVKTVVEHVPMTANYIRSLVYVESFKETLKAVTFLYALQIVGGIFSFTSLVLIAFIGLFSLPMVYSLKKKEIDEVSGKVMTSACGVLQTVTSKIPGMKPAAVKQE